MSPTGFCLVGLAVRVRGFIPPSQIEQITNLVELFAGKPTQTDRSGFRIMVPFVNHPYNEYFACKGIIRSRVALSLRHFHRVHVPIHRARPAQEDLWGTGNNAPEVQSGFVDDGPKDGTGLSSP
jgi:hypothetical protein